MVKIDFFFFFGSEYCCAENFLPILPLASYHISSHLLFLLMSLFYSINSFYTVYISQLMSIRAPKYVLFAYLLVLVLCSALSISGAEVVFHLYQV